MFKKRSRSDSSEDEEETKFVSPRTYKRNIINDQHKFKKTKISKSLSDEQGQIHMDNSRITVVETIEAKSMENAPGCDQVLPAIDCPGSVSFLFLSIAVKSIISYQMCILDFLVQY